MDDAVIFQMLLVAFITLIGSACQAAIGMGLNLLAIPLLLLINPIYAPGPVMVASMLLSMLALWRVPAKVEWSELKYALAGLLVGTVIASIIVSQMDTSTFVRILGLLVVLAVCLILSGWSAPISNRNLVVAGSSAGLMGTIAGVHGPPIALLYQKQSPERIRGSLLTFIGLGNGCAIVALYFAGHFGQEQLSATLVLLPGVFLGLWFAPTLTKILSAKMIRYLVLIISVISGLALVIQ